jgi:hypothetical protein
MKNVLLSEFLVNLAKGLNTLSSNLLPIFSYIYADM